MQIGLEMGVVSHSLHQPTGSLFISRLRDGVHVSRLRRWHTESNIETAPAEPHIDVGFVIIFFSLDVAPPEVTIGEPGEKCLEVAKTFCKGQIHSLRNQRSSL